MDTLEQVEKYWDSHHPGTQFIPETSAEVGGREYFEQLDKALERWEYKDRLMDRIAAEYEGGRLLDLALFGSGDHPGVLLPDAHPEEGCPFPVQSHLHPRREAYSPPDHEQVRLACSRESEEMSSPDGPRWNPDYDSGHRVTIKSASKMGSKTRSSMGASLGARFPYSRQWYRSCVSSFFLCSIRVATRTIC